MTTVWCQPFNGHPSCLRPITAMSTTSIHQSSHLFATIHCKVKSIHSSVIPPVYDLSLQGQQQPIIGHQSSLQPFTARSTTFIQQTSLLFVTYHSKVNNIHSSVIPPVFYLSLQSQQQPFINQPSCLQPFTARSAASIHQSYLLLATFYCKVNSSHSSVIPPVFDLSLKSQQQPFIHHPSCLRPFTAMSSTSIHQSSLMLTTIHFKVNSSHPLVIPPVGNLSLQGQ